MPKFPDPTPIEAPPPLPTTQQAPAAPVMPAPAAYNPTPAAPMAPMPAAPAAAPPPQLAQGNAEDATIKRLKSKRGALQQANSGTSALRIQSANSIGPASADNGKASTGLNIPK